MKVTCKVIQDLLPLYVDGVCAPDTAALVEEHLASCPACREELGRLASAQTGGEVRCAVKVGKAPPPQAGQAAPASAEHDNLDDLLAFGRQFDNIIIQE